MSYYGAGDYYGAGGLGSFFGGIIRRAAPVIGGALTGGMGGAVLGAIGSLGGRGSPPRTVPLSIAGPGSMPARSTGIGLPGSLRINPLNVFPGGKPLFTSDAPGMAPRGYHLNKSGYFLRDGTYVAPRSRYVRNRSRNNANGRALRKAISRVRGFERLVKGSRKSLRSLSRI